MNILKSHADKFEQGGIDEAYLDISTQVKDFNEAGEFGKRLMEEVLEKERLTCSVGVGPNKLVAKIGSDYKKPLWTDRSQKRRCQGFSIPAECQEIPGVGPKTERALKEFKYRDC